MFDVIPPMQYVGADAYRKDWQDFLAGYKAVTGAVNNLQIETDGKLAFTHSIQPMAATDNEGKPVNVTFRVTDCLRKVKGKWLIVHEHISVPVDLKTGKAELQAKM